MEQAQAPAHHLPPGAWRRVGLALLEAGDLRALRALCLACKDAHRALEPELSDVTAPGRALQAFRSPFLRERLCEPCVTELARALREMRAAPCRRPSSLWVAWGAGAGDAAQTVRRVVEGQRDGDECGVGVGVFDCARDCGALLTFALLRREAASRNGHGRPAPVLLVLLGVTAEAWRHPAVVSWALNHLGYRASVVLVSPPSPADGRPPPPPAFLRHTMDRTLHVRGARVATEAEGLRPPATPLPCGCSGCSGQELQEKQQ